MPLIHVTTTQTCQKWNEDTYPINATIKMARRIFVTSTFQMAVNGTGQKSTCQCLHLIFSVVEQHTLFGLMVRLLYVFYCIYFICSNV